MYLKRNISHGFGEVIGFQAVPVVQMLSEKHSHLEGDCREHTLFSYWQGAMLLHIKTTQFIHI